MPERKKSKLKKLKIVPKLINNVKFNIKSLYINKSKQNLPGQEHLEKKLLQPVDQDT